MSQPAAGARPPDHQAGHWRALREFVYVDRPFRDVRRLIADQPWCVVAGSTQAHVAGVDLERDIRMVIGELQVGPHSARLPVRWEDTSLPMLFPFLEGTLEFIPVAAGRRPTTQIGFFGRYQPPLGALGDLGDRLVGHRIVLDSVLIFLDDLSRRLERDLPAGTPPLPSGPERPGDHP